jgi:uncharacterized protein YjbI with pentapeptide repeats
MSAANKVDSSFVCACQKWNRVACAQTGFYKEYEGKRYCVFHYPFKDKVDDFNRELQEKLEAKDLNFQGFWFPSEVNFYKFHFEENTDFSQAIFMVWADFAEAVFEKSTDFYGAEFMDDAIFHNAHFISDTNFKFAEFQAVADFNGSSFFKSINFSHAKFFDDTSFSGNDATRIFKEGSCLAIQYSQISFPGKFLFQNVDLRPSWFVGLDVRHLIFSDVRWNSNLTSEIANVPRVTNLSHLKASPYRLLSTAYRQLAINSEENHRYSEASAFRYCSMDTERREAFRGMAFWRLDWWYWLLSGYSERVQRASLVFVIILVVFAVLYTKVKFEHPITQSGMSLSFSDAVLYSLQVGTLRNPDPKPLTQIAKYLVFIETILVPLQTALLALAIRRRFLR